MTQEKMGNAVKDDKTAFASVLTDDSAKRENLKTVSDKPKMEIQKEPFKPVEQKMKVTVDVNIAPAILEAAIRDIRNPQLGILSNAIILIILRTMHGSRKHDKHRDSSDDEHHRHI